MKGAKGRRRSKLREGEGPAAAAFWQKPRSVAPQRHSVTATVSKMAGADGDDSLYPIAVLIDELRNEDVQVGTLILILLFFYIKDQSVWHNFLVVRLLASYLANMLSNVLGLGLSGIFCRAHPTRLV